MSHASSIFKDETTFFHEYVPPTLPHREKQLERLMRFFKPLFTDKFVSVNIAIIGQAGVGKTAVAKLFGKQLTEEAKKRNAKILFEYMYCSAARTLSAVLRQVISKNWRKIPITGITGSELIVELNERLNKEDKRLVLVLDEAKLLGGEEIHGLIRSAEFFGYGKARISTIVISRPEDWVAYLQSDLSEDVHIVIELPRYSEEELRDILRYRAKIGFYDGVVSSEICDMVARIASETGNARHGIEILYHAGLIAEKSDEKRITPEMIRIAKNEVYPETSPEILRGLHTHELLTLLAVAITLKEELTAPIGRVYEEYKVICEEYGAKPRTTRNFRNYLRVLSDIQIINTVVKNLKRGRRTIVTLTEIPASILEERVRKLLEEKRPVEIRD
ncbi:MAG: Cdc6/Cdc18 family protein [Candidatus Freyarchaeota archaeon]